MPPRRALLVRDSRQPCEDGVALGPWPRLLVPQCAGGASVPPIEPWLNTPPTERPGLLPRVGASRPSVSRRAAGADRSGSAEAQTTRACLGVRIESRSTGTLP